MVVVSFEITAALQESQIWLDPTG